MKRSALLLSLLFLAGCADYLGLDQTDKLLESAAHCKKYGKAGTILLLGDSNTSNMPAGILPDAYVNCGIGGLTSKALLERLPEYLDLYRPKTVSIMIGTNDMKDAVPVDECLDNCRAVIAIARKHGVSVFFRSIPPTSGNWALFNPQIKNFSEKLALLLQEESAPYVNHRPEWEDQNGFFAAEMSDDGLHLSRQGYDVIRKNFYPKEY